MIVKIHGKHPAEQLVEQFKHPTPLQAGSQGDVQEMPNGNWFVGWGQEPYFSEYSPTGTLIYDAHMWAVKKDKALETESYRTYKFAWEATPYWSPSIAATHKGADVEVWASWNGATAVTSWRLLGGTSPSSLQPLTTATKNTFEITISARYVPYVKVQALNQAGAVIGNSKTIKA